MRATVVALTVGLFLCAAPAASAQRGAAADLAGTSDGAIVSGTIPLKAQGSSTAGVRRVTMSIDGEVVAEVTPGGLKNDAETAYDWDTTRYLSSDQASRNRAYEIRVKVVSNAGAEDEKTVTVLVENSPAAPTGVVATATGSSVALTWDANTEPDILGYRIERFYGDDYVVAGRTEETEYVEERPGGRYSYRVVAVRASSVNSEGIKSAPSAPVTVSVAGAPGSNEGRGALGSKGGARGSRAAGRSGGRIGPGGLPGGASLPTMRGLSGLPDLPDSVPWGTYEKRLPYKLPKGGVVLEAAPARDVAPVWNVVPPDGLRWVALGLLILVLAALSRFWAWRLQVASPPAKIEA